MNRRLGIATVSATMIVLVLAGCGGSEESPSAEPPASEPPATAAPATAAPTTAPEETPATLATTRVTSACAGVGVRETPAVDGKLLVRLQIGVKVRVTDTVVGDAYEAGACGQGGDSWIEIDRVNGKSVESLYGVPYAYAAEGFFK